MTKPSETYQVLMKSTVVAPSVGRTATSATRSPAVTPRQQSAGSAPPVTQDVAPPLFDGDHP